MRVAVVISSWVGHPSKYLLALCESIARHPPGAGHDLFLCANGLDYSPPGELVPLFSEIFIRENTGYNLGAWDHAWRQLPGYERFLFLQDDCLVKRPRWLRDFILRFDSTPACGLVGEHLIRAWDRPWSELTDPRAPRSRRGHSSEQSALANFYSETLARWGIPEGPTARALTAVVHFTSRSILEEVGGYNLGRTYQEAIAAEIGFSRKIEARGYSLVQIGRQRHSRIGHPQWNRQGFFARLRRSVRKRFS
jgi:hypothetical protein